MNKLTILIDMDDTIENLCETWVNFLNKRHNTNISLDDIVEWDMTKAFPTLTKEQVYAPLLEQELWESIKPLPYAVETLKKLIDEGHKIHIVTATHPQNISFKMANIIEKYFPFIDYNDIIITSKKQLIKGDVLIDDAPHNLIDGEYYSILMTAPHNKRYNASKNGMIRVNDWNEVYSVINLLTNAKNIDEEAFEIAKAMRKEHFKKLQNARSSI